MALERSQALILRDRPYSETSRTYSALTERFGMLQFIGKGVRRPKSRLGTHLEWPALGELVFYLHEREGLINLSEANVEETFPVVRADPAKLGHCAAMTELVLRTAPPAQRETRLFAITQAHWMALEGGREPILLLGSFALKWARISGWALEFERCSVCSEVRTAYRLDLEAGGLICTRCAPEREGRPPLDPAMGSFLARLVERPPSALNGEVKPALAKSLLTLMEQIGRHFLPPPGKLVSLDFVRRFSPLVS